MILAASINVLNFFGIIYTIIGIFLLNFDLVDNDTAIIKSFIKSVTILNVLNFFGIIYTINGTFFLNFDLGMSIMALLYQKSFITSTTRVNAIKLFWHFHITINVIPKILTEVRLKNAFIMTWEVK